MFVQYDIIIGDNIIVNMSAKYNIIIGDNNFK